MSPNIEQAEMKPLQLQHVLTHITDYTNDAVIITDAGHIDEAGPKIVFVNPTFTMITGFSAAEALGKDPGFLRGEGTSPVAVAAIESAMREFRPIVLEILNYKKDGSSFWSDMSIVPVNDTKSVHRFSIGIFRETTQLRLQERTLKFQSLAMKATSDAIVVCEVGELSTRTIYGNGPYARLFANGFEAVDFDVLQLFSTARRLEILRTLHQAHGATVGNTLEERIFPPSGPPIEARIFIEPVSADLVGPRALLVRIVDITDEQERKRQVAQSQRLRAVGQLTGGVAHDFNNLLTVITQCSEILLSDEAISDDARSLINIIIQTSDVGSSLTSQLLSFSSCGSLEAQSIPIRSFLERLLQVLRRTLPSTLTLSMVVDPDVERVSADPSQLQSALLNLVINARDALKSTGSITVRAQARTVSESDTGETELEARKYIAITVSDNGPGMTADVMNRAFEPFFTSKDVGQGSGLGLSMVYGFARQSGGRARISSRCGFGTDVELLLPSSSDDGAHISKSLAASRDFDFTKLCVLIVEDDSRVREQVARLLKEMGCRTFSAATALEALDELSKCPSIDVLFTDIVMPGGVNGVQLAKEALKLAPTVKILFTSGYTTESEQCIRDLSSGLNLLQKPYKRSDLMTAITKLFEVSGIAEAA